MFAYYRKVFISLCAQGTSLLLIFIASVAMTRALGVEWRGVATWIVSLNTIAAVFAQGGMGFAGRRFVAEDASRTGDVIILTAFVCAGISAIIIPLALIMDVPVSIQEHSGAFLFGLITIPIVALARCYSDMATGLGKMNIYNSMHLIQGIGQCIIIFAAILFLEINPIYAVIAVIAPAFVKIAVVLWSVKQHINLRLKQPEWLIKHTKSFMFYNYLSSLFLLMINTLPPLLTGFFSSIYEVGLFAACIPFMEALYRIPSVLAAHSIPQITQEKNLARRNKFKVKLLLHTLILMSLAAIFVFIIAKWLIILLYGQEFENSVNIFRWIIPGTVFVAIFTIAQSFIVQEDKSWRIIFAPGISSLIMFIAAFFFISGHGAQGSAIIWTVSNFIAMAIACFIMFRRKGDYE